MANYQNLKAAIDQVIKANGQKEITGPVLNDTLKAIVNSLGAGYQFMGVATPSTNPGTPDQNVLYIAGEAGTYTNFNSIVLPDGVSIIKWNGSWSSETVVGGDGVFDISAYKATGGTLATFADLSAALDGGNNIPSALRKGGMSIKYVQTSDNKYVQYRLMANSFSTTVTDWQGVDDEPIEESHNLIESGTVALIQKTVSEIYSGIRESVFDDNSSYDTGLLKKDGTVDSLSRYRVSPYIEVLPNSIIQYSNLFPYNGDWVGLCVYNENRNKIGSITSEKTTPQSGSIDLSSFDGAKYIRFSPFDDSSNIGAHPVRVRVYAESNSPIWSKVNQIDAEISTIIKDKYGDHTSYTLEGNTAIVALKVNNEGKLKEVWVKSAANANGYIRIYDKDHTTVRFEKQIYVTTGENTVSLSQDNVSVGVDEFIAIDGIKTYYTQQSYKSIFYEYNYTTHAIRENPRTDRVYFSFEATVEEYCTTSRIDSIEAVIGEPSVKIERYNTSNIGDFLTDTQKNVLMYYSPQAEDVIFSKAKLAIQAAVNDSIIIHVGIIDQRGWWIEKEAKEAKVSAVNDGVATISPVEKISVPSGYLIAFELNSNYWKNANNQSIVSLYPEFYTLNTADLYDHVTLIPRSDFIYLTYYEVTWISDTTEFATKDELSEVTSTVEEINRKVLTSNIYIDKTTGTKYLLGVNNGQVVLEPILYDKIYFAGNSFTHHGTNSYWWGDGRGMAASTDDVQYTELLSDIAHATYDKGSYTPIETAINTPSLDMTSYIPSLPNNDYKLLVIQLGENATLRNRTNFVANWKAMIDRFHTLAPNARIIQILGWSTGDKKDAIIEACEEKNVTVIDCVTATATGNFRAGDYTMDSDGITQHVIQSMIITHPSDIGMALIANNVASVLGIGDRIILYDLNVVNNVGGSLSIAYNKWVAGGLVSVKTEPSAGYILQSLNVNDGNQAIPVTLHTDGVCTFIMPSDNVTITPTWETT